MPAKPLNDTAGQRVEAMLEPEILKHGLETVLAHLETLFGRARWSDFQRVGNIARNIARRLERSE